MEIHSRKVFQVACFLGALAVVILAVAAHALKDKLDVQELGSLKTAAEIQLIHAILITALTVNAGAETFRRLKLPINLMLGGIFCFSFSIYVLLANNFLRIPFLKYLWPVTPVGGLLLIASWLLLMMAPAKKSAAK
jgi:uncharacterized membrane protein YgdD (TMEM256/DUF423 family)